jgi:alpha-beta hydrolase superfamily lysophospholipase
MIVPGAFSDADSFEDVARWLSERGRQTYILRLPQRNSRIPQLDPGGLEAMDRAIDAACDEIGMPLTAFGHSMGGLAVLRLLARRRLSAAALMMPVPPRGLGPDAVRLLREQPIDAVKMIGLSLGAWPVRNLPGRPPRGMFRDDTPADVIDASAARRVSESWRVLTQMMIGSREPVGPVDTPLLLVGGSQDSIVSASTVSRLATDLDCSYLEFDVGHAFAEEPGYDRVLDATLDWLAGNE